MNFQPPARLLVRDRVLGVAVTVIQSFARSFIAPAIIENMELNSFAGNFILRLIPSVSASMMVVHMSGRG